MCMYVCIYIYIYIYIYSHITHSYIGVSMVGLRTNRLHSKMHQLQHHML